MKDFNDLVFEKHSNAYPGGLDEMSKLFFDNGYGVSVIKGGYGSVSAPYELAVLKGNKSSYNLCYSTDITDDVLGYLEPNDVSEIMKKVQELDKPTYRD